ncbi:hypothetical protein A2U01_0052037, partial [Trifolium medium]|nr:hypothetical protein [Trifolium medium]
MHQFSGSKHIQVTATALFGIRQRHDESLREFLARFSEETIKVSNPSQEMFVAAFQNGLKESNAEKISRDVKERGLDLKDGKGPERGPRRRRGRYGRPYEPPRYDREEGRG